MLSLVCFIGGYSFGLVKTLWKLNAKGLDPVKLFKPLTRPQPSSYRLLTVPRRCFCCCSSLLIFLCVHVYGLEQYGHLNNSTLSASCSVCFIIYLFIYLFIFVVVVFVIQIEINFNFTAVFS